MATHERTATGALTGTRVVDLTRYASGPVCTQTLGDMGAEVIKVEPLTGDPSRWNPPVVEDWGGYFPYFNRNKKSLALDMTRKEGQQVLTRLMKWGDVLVENFRPGVMDRLGFGYEKVKAINPRLIVVSVSGFGQTGP
ncbi:MAG: CoA transferase, partial [Dehalococcoidia bacterium]|nr:CoA transferase [Dehalococcoidia bacterium]